MPRFRSIIGRRSVFSPPLKTLVSDDAEEVRSYRSTSRIVGTSRTQQLQKTLLDDIFGVRRRSSQSVREAEQRQMMLVEQSQKGGLPALASFFDHIHLYLSEEY